MVNVHNNCSLHDSQQKLDFVKKKDNNVILGIDIAACNSLIHSQMNS